MIIEFTCSVVVGLMSLIEVVGSNHGVATSLKSQWEILVINADEQTHDRSVIVWLMPLIEVKGSNSAVTDFFESKLLAIEADEQLTMKRNRVKDLLLNT